MRTIATAVILSAAVGFLCLAPICGGTGSPGPAGLLETSTLFAVYGRGFGIGPILGHLGTYRSIEAMADDVRTWPSRIAPLNGGRKVTIGMDLIYGLAIPCKAAGNCLEYLDQVEKDLAAEYIKPAADRGWVVILDTQLGRSNPVAEVQRMIDRGYLRYDNVHVALDPEFHVAAGHNQPGIPIGTITAAQVNLVQDLLNRYVDAQGLKTKKILIVHQFGDAAVHDGVPYMIANKKDLKSFANIELVIDADGLGTPAEKIRKFNLMTDSKIYPAVQFAGIKVFYPNQWEHAGHFDKPPLSLEQVFGASPAPGGVRMAREPSVLIIA